MLPFTPDRLAERLAQTPPIWIGLWSGLLLLTVALFVLARTRWGQSQPMRKCVILSLLAHGLLICFATAIQVVQSTTRGPSEPTLQVVLVDVETDGDRQPVPTDRLAAPDPNDAIQPWDPHPSGRVVEPDIALPEPADKPFAPLTDLIPTPPAPISSCPISGPSEPNWIDSTQSISKPERDLQTTKIPQNSSPSERMATTSDWTSTGATSGNESDPFPARSEPIQWVTTAHRIYRYRSTTERHQAARRSGGDDATEAAVHEALGWLARSQSEDGRWSAARYGAGHEQVILGHDRQGAGVRADTGVTGLALLAFLGAGQTHRQGDYRATVAKGLEFLKTQQGQDGNLAGPATLYARTYCHAMALFALAETYAMTGDEQLEKPVRDAVRFSIIAQNPSTGGWRYRPGDIGDTSQLGWQVMALRSAELGGLSIPAETWQGVTRFLSHVSSGRHGGLAGYQPGSRPSRTMTAEAAYCRQLARVRANPVRPQDIDAGNTDREAAAYLLSELPGEGRTNLYYWYYASLFLHARAAQGHDADQGEWLRWNDALKSSLLARQIRQPGPFAGSWAPDTVWGGYGGRVYSTAIAALCLEVYYRYAGAEELVAGTPHGHLQR